MSFRPFAAALLAAPMLCQAQQLEIKGYKLGMTQDQAYEVYMASERAGGLSVGGVSRHKGQSSSSLQAKTTFDQARRLDSLRIAFHPGDFDPIEEALRTKYQDTQCIDGTVESQLGVKRPQRICLVLRPGEAIKLTRYQDMNNGELSLLPYKPESATDADKRRKDF